MDRLRLSPPSVEFRDSYLAALDEFQREGRYLDRDRSEIAQDFPGFVAKRLAKATEEGQEEGLVPQTEFWLVDGTEYLGRVTVRHRLNEKLLRMGGHIGYDIRPSARKKGHGNRILALALPEARKLGIRRALLTCDSTNVGSRRIIESNGGILENEVAGEEGGPSKLRFWIGLD